MTYVSTLLLSVLLATMTILSIGTITTLGIAVLRRLSASGVCNPSRHDKPTSSKEDSTGAPLAASTRNVSVHEPEWWPNDYPSGREQ